MFVCRHFVSPIMMENSRPSFHWADYLVFVAMLMTSSAIGIFYAFKSRKNNSSGEFMLASRKMTFFPVSMSLTATLLTGIYLQGSVSETYLRGVFLYMGSMAPFTIAGAIAGLVFMPKFYKMRLTSIYEYIGMRFNKPVQFCCLFIGYVYMFFISGLATRAASLVLTTVTGSRLGVTSAAIILSAVCTFYTVIGGMKAVLWADVFQMTLMFICLIAAGVQTSIKLGFATVWTTNMEGGRFNEIIFDPDPRIFVSFWSVVIGGILTWLTLLVVLPHQMQRYNSCKTQAHAHAAFAFYIFFCNAITLFCTLAGMAMYAIYVNCDPISSGKLSDPDGLLPYYILEAFHHLPGIPGILVSGLCSAALSTISSILNSAATVTVTHTVSKIWKDLSDSRYLFITRIIVVLFGCLNIAVTIFVGELGNLLRAVIGLIGVTNSPVCAVFILGFFFRRANAKGTLIGFVLGTAVGIWLFIGSLFYQGPPINLDLSTEMCLDEEVTSLSMTNDSSTTMMATTLYNLSTAAVPDVIPRSFVIELYNISRLWYTTITLLSVCIISMVASLIMDAIYGKPEVDSNLLWSWRDVCSFNNKTENPNQTFSFEDKSDVGKVEQRVDPGESGSFSTQF
ncbi:sodium-coupled monocarboxylate transporter 1-like isoform X1 [Asterias amurensis]|uniref:sodium-coupled monocarboxylate transporter 1-like isoform X1 n=2 Tax=Asterias amurensis TaxID=7602 RepID=UPI003AB6E652